MIIQEIFQILNNDEIDYLYKLSSEHRWVPNLQYSWINGGNEDFDFIYLPRDLGYKNSCYKIREKIFDSKYAYKTQEELKQICEKEKTDRSLIIGNIIYREIPIIITRISLWILNFKTINFIPKHLTSLSLYRDKTIQEITYLPEGLQELYLNELVCKLPNYPRDLKYLQIFNWDGPLDISLFSNKIEVIMIEDTIRDIKIILSKGEVPPNFKYFYINKNKTEIIELDEKLYDIPVDYIKPNVKRLTMGEILEYQKNGKWEYDDEYLTDIKLKCSSCDHILNDMSYPGFPGYTTNVYFNESNKELICNYCYEVKNYSSDYQYYYYNFQERDNFIYFCDDCDQEMDWLEKVYHLKKNESVLELQSENHDGYNDYCEDCFNKKNVEYDCISFNGIKK